MPIATARRGGNGVHAAVLAALALPSIALAQAPAPRADDSAQLTEVVVTGSRIRRVGFDTLEPAGVVTSEYIESRGLTNIADALNESPGFGTGITPEGGQSTFGPGLNFVNRFGLGTNRTLTLINGRRFVSSNAPSIFSAAAPGGQVDLNFVPTVLIDQIENLAVGGAPTYGADAIAGVVNVKLKKDFDGIQGFAQFGQLEDGEGQNSSYGLVAGGNFFEDRLSVTASLQYSTIEGIEAISNRRFADAYAFAVNPTASTVQPGRTPTNDGRVNTSVPFNTGAADGIPNAVLIRNRRLFSLTFGGLALPTGANNLADGRLRCFGATSTTCLNFDGNGNLVPYNPGVNFGTTDASGGDGLYLVETLQLGTDLKRTSATVSTTFALNDNVNLFFDAYGYKSEALEIVDQTPFNATLFGGNSGTITFPSNHPVLTTQAQQALAALGVSTFRISRAHRDIASNRAQGESDLFQGVFGANGDFEAANRSFNWEAYVNYGKNDLVFFSNQLNRQRFVNALNVVRNASGQLVCSPTPGYAGLPAAQGGRVQVGADLPVADPNCVPLDIFGEGRPSQAARDYIASIQRSDASIEQTVFNANLGSNLFDIWGGPIGYNLGYERRKESGEFVPDAYLAAGLGRSAQITPNSGSYTTDEIFAEILAPLVSENNDVPLVHRLTLTAKGRRVDNSVNGEFDSYTLGLQWAPIEDIELRGNVTRSLRAPALTELFTPVAPIFATTNDPCDARNLTGGTNPAARQRNCAQFYQQFGITGPFQSLAVSATTQGSLQGDTGLRNEAANAWTAGFVLRPRFAPGLELAVDWVDIRIKDVITNLAANDLATACFDSDNYPNEYCSRFTRNPASAAPGDRGQITFVRTGYANGAFQSMRGVTAEGRYEKDLSELLPAIGGVFEVGLSYYRLQEELRSATGIVTVDSQEVLGSPTDTVQLNLIYEKGPFAARWQANWQSAQLYSRTFNVETRDILEVDAVWNHNLSLAYRFFDDKAVARLAVTNLFDEPAPFPIGGDAFGGNFDFLGRRYSVSLTYDFK